MHEVRDHDAEGLNRFAAIKYVNNEGKFVYMYSARHHNDASSSYICQMQQQGLFKPYSVTRVTAKRSRLSIVIYIEEIMKYVNT